jgi:hypothetical protein
VNVWHEARKIHNKEKKSRRKKKRTEGRNKEKSEKSSEELDIVDELLKKLNVVCVTELVRRNFFLTSSITIYDCQSKGLQT